MHTVLSFEVGGLEKVVCDNILAFDRDKFGVEACCFDRIGDFANRLFDNHIEVHFLQRNQNHYDIFFPIKLSRLLRQKQIHLLHMHNGTFFLGVQAGLLARTPVMVYTEHGRPLVEPKVLIHMDRLSAYFVDKIISVSKELEEYLKNVVRLPAEKIVTLINGVDTERFKKRIKSPKLLKEFCIDPDVKVIGTVSRLTEVKDQFTMIESFAAVKESYPKCILLLVGDGPMKSELVNMVERKSLKNCVIFAGKRNDISDVLNLFDIFLLTSLSEGTSISLLEAMSSGVTPIATKVGGNVSIVDDNLNGMLTSPKNTYELSNKLKYLLNNDDIRNHFSANARKKIRSCFSLEIMVRKYENLYLRLLEKNFSKNVKDGQAKVPLNLAGRKYDKF